MMCGLQFRIHPAAPLSVMDVCCDWSTHGIDCGVREIGSITQYSLAVESTILHQSSNRDREKNCFTMKVGYKVTLRFYFYH